MSRSNEGRIEYNETARYISQQLEESFQSLSALNELTDDDKMDIHKAREKMRKILAKTTDLSINDNDH